MFVSPLQIARVSNEVVCEWICLFVCMFVGLFVRPFVAFYKQWMMKYGLRRVYWKVVM